MKFKYAMLGVAAVIFSVPLAAVGGVIDGVNWADDVAAYSSGIQNYGSVLMDENTEFWLTGVPDADVDDNGYAWDAGDLDYVAGWRAGTPNEFITVHFNLALANVSGDDLSIYLYGGGKVDATVYASTDGSEYTEIGSIGGGTAGYLRVETFDFDGLLDDGGVHYVKVARNTVGSGSGLFIDAFGGTAVPEPGSVALLVMAGLAALGAFVYRKRR